MYDNEFKNPPLLEGDPLIDFPPVSLFEMPEKMQVEFMSAVTDLVKETLVSANLQEIPVDFIIHKLTRTTGRSTQEIFCGIQYGVLNRRLVEDSSIVRSRVAS